MPLEFAFLTLLGGALMYLLILLLRGGSPGLRSWYETLARRGLGGRSGRRGPGSRTAGEAKGAGRLRICPLCGETLARGELVKSVVFSGGSKHRSGRLIDTMSHLFGCPFCYPPNDNHRRMCPYCKNEVPRDGHVIARYFDNRETGRKHVHVLGCTGCRRRSA